MLLAESSAEGFGYNKHWQQRFSIKDDEINCGNFHYQKAVLDTTVGRRYTDTNTSHCDEFVEQYSCSRNNLLHESLNIGYSGVDLKYSQMRNADRCISASSIGDIVIKKNGYEYISEAVDGTSTNITISLRDRNRVRNLKCYEHIRRERKAIINMTKPLKAWLYRNKVHPYPSKADKVYLARQANMTLTQVSNWFANARRRLKNTVKASNIAWDQRIRLYNSYISENAEVLSMHSEDDDGKTQLLSEEPRQSQNYHNQYGCFEQVKASSNFQENTKAKQMMLQRYLNDSLKYGLSSSHYPEFLAAHSKAYSVKPSVNSADGDSSTSDECTSPETHWPINNKCTDTCDVFTEESNTDLKPDELKRGQLLSTLHEDLTAKEISAVMALTHLALGFH